MTNRGDEMSHISFENLTDYADGRLDEAASKLVEAHLAENCESCTSDLSWLQETLLLMRSDDWVAPPANLNTRVISAFRDHFEESETRLSLLDRIGAFFTPRPQLAWGAAAAVILLVVFFAAFAIGGRTVELEATAVATAGTVIARSTEDEEWQEVELGTTFSVGDTIRTGESSSIILAYDDESFTVVESNTEIHILEMSSSRNGSNQVIILGQNVGRTLHEINEFQDDDSFFEVRTPSAAVTVVGTVFTVDVDFIGNTVVWVDKGIVAVSGGGNTVQLTAGESTYVEIGGGPTAVTATPSPTATETDSSGAEPAAPTPEGLPDTPPPYPYLSNPSPEATASGTATASPEPSETNTPTPSVTATASSTITPTPTSIPPTFTPPPPTSTPAPPTSTPRPPTSTPKPPPPTSTLVPPTSTPVPPTSTPIPPPPTATQVPDNNTPYPPQPNDDASSNPSGDSTPAPPGGDTGSDPYP